MGVRQLPVSGSSGCEEQTLFHIQPRFRHAHARSRKGETPVPGAEGRGQLTEKLPWRRQWIGYGADGRGLRRAKPRSRVSQWQLLPSLPSAGKGGGLHLQLLLSCRKGVSPGAQTRLLALRQTSRLQAGMSPQRGARLSRRITASGKCEVLNGLARRDMQTDGCEKLF